MAISNATIAALPDYTDAELLKVYRWGLANNAAGTTRSLNGRTVSFPSTEDMWKTIERLESRITAADTTDDYGEVALAVFRPSR